jgi:uncharacterized SAM-binding protein YcdF (DUF218 family)
LKRRRRYFFIAALCLWPLLAFAAAQLLVVNYPLRHSDILVVLSGSAAYKERIQEAAKIYNQGRADRIVMTNDNQQGEWSQEKQRNPFFYERGLDEFARLGVPRERIEVLAPPVTSTYDEALLLRTFLASNQVKSAVIITSPYHSRRAFWTFRRVCANANLQLGIETVALGIDSPGPATWWLKPKGWLVVGGEYLKLVYYWFHVR